MAATEAVAALTAAFERIATTRMAGLPMNNPALRVAATGFRPWAGDYRVGVLITPWAINLVILGAGLRLAADRRQTWDFPSGSYEFMGGDEPECGAFQFCSLFSPAFEFAGQDEAVATGREIMAGLLREASDPAGEKREMVRLAGSSALQVPTSRRSFLRGIVGGLKA
jgi:[NiFe] hydrogenase assembly HybE family chaperone